MGYRRAKQRSGRENRPWKTPPSYFSRAVQVRLIVLVAMFMLIVLLMTESRKPENWQWMWGGKQQGNAETPTQGARPRRLQQPAKGHISGDGASPIDQDAAPRRASDNGFRAAQLEAWSELLGQLATEDETLLREILKAERDRRPLRDDERNQGPRIVLELDKAWKNHLAKASEAIDLAGEDPPVGERVRWRNVLQQLEDHWGRHLKPAFLALVEQRELSQSDRDRLAELQAVWDGLALAAVEDDTVLRRSERDCWFRLLEILDRADQAELTAMSVGPVSYLQLYRQPREYRGRIVSVRGVARRAYYVRARSNFYGIDEYYVFWIKPRAGPNRPIVVYALELPPGFPAVTDRDDEEGALDLNEEVQFVGFFFKRWAYRASEGIATAPLMLAKAPRWRSPISQDIAENEPLDAAADSSPQHQTSVKTRSRWVRFPTLAGDLAPPPWARPGAKHLGPQTQRISRPRDFLVNVDDALLESFADGQSLDAAQGALTRILYCLPRLGPGDAERLQRTGVSWSELAAEPDRGRMEVFRLRGRVKRVLRKTLAPETASLLEYDHYFIVHFQLDDDLFPAVVYVRQVPSAWTIGQDMDQRASAFGLFLQVGEGGGDHPPLVFAAHRVAWLPDREQKEYGIGAGQVTLAQLGMDVGLLDDVRDRNGKPMEVRDRECFYQLLAAAGRAEPGELEQRAARGFALTQLLQDPAPRQGRLELLQASARRVTEIVVEDADIRERFGIDRYYEIDAFLPLEETTVRLGRQEGDEEGPVFSNNFPATLCVVRLPPELAAKTAEAVRTGAPLNEKIQLAGFFFRLWTHESEYVSSFDERQLQVSPLFIGREPQLISSTSTTSPYVGLVCGLAFLAGLAAVWLGLYRQGLSRRQSGLAALRRRLERRNGRPSSPADIAAEDSPDFSALD